MFTWTEFYDEYITRIHNVLKFITENIIKNLEIQPVKWIDQVLEMALVQMPSAKETESLLSLLTEELRNVVFLVGAENVQDLAKVPVVVTGKTAEWLKTRGFSVEGYAKRRAR